MFHLIANVIPSRRPSHPSSTPSPLRRARPSARRRVALHRDAGIEDVVLREADLLCEALEQAPQLGVSAGGRDALAVPDGVFGEDLDDPVRVVCVVADVAVLGLPLLDRLDVLQLGQASFEFMRVHTSSAMPSALAHHGPGTPGKSIAARRGSPPNCCQSTPGDPSSISWALLEVRPAPPVDSPVLSWLPSRGS